MDYKKIYDDFIENRRGLNPLIFEKHHIIPKSCNGNNEDKNIINLKNNDKRKGPQSQETKDKKSDVMMGRDHTWGDKISQALSLIKDITCPTCGITGKPAGMKRWHFENCGKINNKVECPYCGKIGSGGG